MIKKIWILNHEVEDIQSVNQISKNLCQLYLSLPKENFEILEINLMDPTIKNLIIQFKENTPEHIAIVHPSVISHIFLNALLSVKTTIKPQFIFHIFGNFIRYGENWFSLNHLLSKKNVQFIVASKCYFDLLTNFISLENLYQLPFPISSTKEIDDALSEKVESEPLNILYAGRYHEQKNVTVLIYTLNDIAKTTKRKIYLNLATYFDDFNPTTLNTERKLGKQFNDYLKATKGLSDYFQIKLLPHQNTKKLNELYLNNDMLISFSTFLDEDYGNIVIESLEKGTPCIVSSWGGYKDFCHEFPNDCFGLDVILEKEKLYLDTEKLSSLILEIANRNNNQRKKLKQKVEKYIGLEKMQLNLQSIFLRETLFSTFNQSLLTFSRELKNQENKSIIVDFKKYYNSFWQTR